MEWENNFLLSPGTLFLSVCLFLCKSDFTSMFINIKHHNSFSIENDMIWKKRIFHSHAVQHILMSGLYLQMYLLLYFQFFLIIL